MSAEIFFFCRLLVRRCREHCFVFDCISIEIKKINTQQIILQLLQCRIRVLRILN